MGAKSLFSQFSTIGCSILAAAGIACAALPKSSDLVADMGMGYNIGNTMEVPEDPTLWGNVFPTKRYIDSVKAAGFNTVRIPTAWFTHSNASNNTIDAGWLDSVKTVVDYCIANDMYVILNSHWDNGWLEDNVFTGSHPDRNNVTTTTDSSVVRKRQYDYWKQIATKFQSYDKHLIFAGANEPGVNDPRAKGTAYGDNGQYTFDDVRMRILRAYYQAFVDAVRETGGNNSTRTLIVQAPRTEIEKTELLSTHLPTDPSGTGYLMAEVHFYPYQFSLMDTDADWGKALYYWGSESDPVDTQRNASSYGPAFVDEEFALMKTKFVNNGIPVVVGELGAIKRLSTLSGDALARHLRSRAAFYGYVAASAKANGLIPVIWDTGAEDDKNMTVIRRQTADVNQVGRIVDYEVLNAMRKAYGLAALTGNSIDALVKESLSTANRSLQVTYDYAQDTNSFGSIRILSTKKDLSAYKGISVRAFVTGKTEEVGGEFGFFSMDLAVMTGSAWTWTDAHFSTISMDAWKDYTFTFTSIAANEDKDNQVLYLTDPKTVNAFTLQAYVKNFVGSVTIDQVLLLKTNGTVDTLESFNRKIPETDGGILSATLVPTPAAADALPIVSAALASAALQFRIAANQVFVQFESAVAGPVTLQLTNAQGQVLSQKRMEAVRGSNRVALQSSTHGPGVLVVQQGKQRFSVPVLLQ